MENRFIQAFKSNFLSVEEMRRIKLLRIGNREIQGCNTINFDLYEVEGMIKIESLV